MFREPTKQELRQLAQEAVSSSPITHVRPRARSIPISPRQWEDRVRMTKEELGIVREQMPPMSAVGHPVAPAALAPNHDPVLYQLALALRQAGII